MPLLSSLLFLILLSRLFGQITSRLGQPSLVGEILAGVILGPALLKLIQPSPALAGIADLTVFLIVFATGLEMDFRKVAGAFKGKGLLVAAIGFLVPLVFGILTGLLFHLDTMRTLFLGLCISITALPVAVKILEGFGMLDSTIARFSIAAAVINDVACLMFLGVLVDLPSQSDYGAVALSILIDCGKLVGFALGILLIYWILGRLKSWKIDPSQWLDHMVYLFGPEFRFGLAVVFVMIFSSISEGLGFHAVIGAFFGALLIDQKIFGFQHFNKVHDTINSISTGFLAPIYFAYLGLEFNPASIGKPWLALAVLAVSMGSKILAGYWAGKLVGLKKESLGLGIILNSRGVMELVVANIALEKGFIGPGLFSILVLMGLITTVATPLLFHKFHGGAAVPAVAEPV